MALSSHKRKHDIATTKGQLGFPRRTEEQGALEWRDEDNKLRTEDRPVHDWYRFVLSFPPHLVRRYLERFDVGSEQTVLDPFCGTGTTLVECKKCGIQSVGIEANPMACLASTVKTDWNIDGSALLSDASAIAEKVNKVFSRQGLDEYDLPLFGNAKEVSGLKHLPQDLARLLLKNSISPIPLHRTLELLEAIDRYGVARFAGHQRLALAKGLVNGISNLHFGPEVGVSRPKQDAPVVAVWKNNVGQMARDIPLVSSCKDVFSAVHLADARCVSQTLAPHSVDAVITSPPYPNEKDYTRTTRLESVVLGLISGKQNLRGVKETLVRSNTRGVYRCDDDDVFVRDNPEIQRIGNEIEARRKAMGKTSGFERMYARVTRLYFGGMARHLADLRKVLRPGACLAYVVGDQASYLQVMIRTGELLARIAESLGYEVLDIDLFRTRLATATKEQLREEVVLLRWCRGHK